MRKKVLGWILIIYSIAVFLMVLTYLILNPIVAPFWLPIAFIVDFLPFNIGFYYVFGARKIRRRKHVDGA